MQINPLLDKKTEETLRNYASLSDASGVLHKQVLKILFKKKLFKLFVPAKYGGLQLPLPDALRLEEKLAAIDGSLGWTVTLCAGANFFAGYIDERVAGTIFKKEKVCWGGSGAIGGIAEQTGNGYRINGFWKYATGAPHLTHFTANCAVTKAGKPVLLDNGDPMVLSFYFNREEVIVHKDWNAMGLKATASHSFSVNNLVVPGERAFKIDESAAIHTNPVYRYPFLQFAEITIAVNTLGMTKHFFDEAFLLIDKRWQERKSTTAQFKTGSKSLRQWQTKISIIETEFYKVADDSWNKLLAKDSIPAPVLNKLSRLSRQLTKSCRQAVTENLPFFGIVAAAGNSTINRIFRDIFTASQHSLLAY